MMSTYNYRCLAGCGETGLQRVFKASAEKDSPTPCSKCGSPMKLMGEVYNCFASFGSKSPEEKKEVIKKRANEHTKTKMKDRVHEVRKRILGGK